MVNQFIGDKLPRPRALLSPKLSVCKARLVTQSRIITVDHKVHSDVHAIMVQKNLIWSNFVLFVFEYVKNWLVCHALYLCKSDADCVVFCEMEYVIKTAEEMNFLGF